MPDPKAFFSIPQAARLCGVSRTTVWNWVKSGHVKAFVTPGGHHRILKIEIERMLSENGQIAAEPTAPQTILLVDDDLQLLKTLQVRLKRAGYRTDTAKDGFEAGIKVLQLKPDLVILDLLMPGVDGFDVCRTIKQNENLTMTKVLVLTGFDDPEYKARVLALGADGYFPKSISPGVLIEKINALMTNG